jgi:hypothetical protein
MVMDGRIITHEKFDVRLCGNSSPCGAVHDTGYIQEDWDIEKEQGKYTKSHVERSGAFVEKNASIFIFHHQM